MNLHVHCALSVLYIINSGGGVSCSVVSNSLQTPWTGVHQAPLSMAFSRPEHWNWLPFPSPGDLPNQQLNLGLPHCRQIIYHLSQQGSPHNQ